MWIQGQVFPRPAKAERDRLWSGGHGAPDLPGLTSVAGARGRTPATGNGLYPDRALIVKQGARPESVSGQARA